MTNREQKSKYYILETLVSNLEEIVNGTVLTIYNTNYTVIYRLTTLLFYLFISFRGVL